MNRCGLAQLRQRFIKEGFEVTHKGKTHNHRPKKLGRVDEASLIALACSPNPEGRKHWTLWLLRDTWSAIPQNETKTISHEIIRSILRKTKLSLC